MPAARAPHELEQFGVAHHVGAHLGRPGDHQVLGDHQLEQMLEPLRIGRQVVVAEEDLLGALGLDLSDDVLGAAEAVLAPEHRRHRAEGAAEGAAPARHDRHVGDLLVADQQVEGGKRQAVEVGAARAQRVVDGAAVSEEGKAGDRIELAVAAQRLDELGHELFAALAASDVVDVVERLVGHEGDMRAADHHRDTLGAQPVGDLVGCNGRTGGGAQPHEVATGDVVPVDGRQLGTVDENVVTLARKRRRDDR